jgi:hypothetical protein
MAQRPAGRSGDAVTAASPFFEAVTVEMTVEATEVAIRLARKIAASHRDFCQPNSHRIHNR